MRAARGDFRVAWQLYRRVGVLPGPWRCSSVSPRAVLRICVLLAVAGRRRRELILWVVGAAIFALVYYLHVTRVWAHQEPGDILPLPWVRFGHVRFTLETIRQTNWWLARTPAVFTAIFAVLLAASPCAPAIPAHLRAAVIVYAVFFFVVGRTFNDYWGFVTAPMTSVAVAYGYDGIRYVMERSRSAPCGERIRSSWISIIRKRRLCSGLSSAHARFSTWGRIRPRSPGT